MTQTDIQDNNANKIKVQDKINIIRAKYIASAVKKAQYPEERLKEIAFIRRLCFPENQTWVNLL